MDPQFLTLDEVLEIHQQQVALYGGSVRGRQQADRANAITFLLINDWEPDLSEDELVDLVIGVASSALAKPSLTQRFEMRCRPASNPMLGLANRLPGGWRRCRRSVAERPDFLALPGRGGGFCSADLNQTRLLLRRVLGRRSRVHVYP
jgi:hypothetical protein